MVSLSIELARSRSKKASPTLTTPLALGWSSIVVALATFMLWSAFAPLASAVLSSGVVVIDGSNKTLQSVEAGVVTSIFVRDGEMVKLGQPLLKLDDSSQRSSLKVLTREICSNAAHQARLRTELADRPAVSYPASVHGVLTDQAKDILADEDETFRVKRSALLFHIDELHSEQAGVRATIAGLNGQLAALTARLVLVKESLQASLQLYREGSGSRKAVRETTAEVAGLAGDISEIESKRTDLQNQVARLAMEAQRLGISSKEIDAGDLQKVSVEQQDLFQRYDQILISANRTLLRSPSAGEIMNLAMHTVGGVVMPGSPILEIVPTNVPLVVEARIIPTDVSNVKVGASVLISPEGEAGLQDKNLFTGHVVSITADRLTDRETESPFFLVSISVDKTRDSKADRISLRPGASMTVMILRERKTLLSYLISPIIQGLSHSLRE